MLIFTKIKLRLLIHFAQWGKKMRKQTLNSDITGFTRMYRNRKHEVEYAHLHISRVCFAFIFWTNLNSYYFIYCWFFPPTTLHKQILKKLV